MAKIGKPPLEFVPDGIILDVDGTLWNSTGIVAQAWTQAVRENSTESLEVQPEDLQRLFGRTMDEIADALLPQLAPAQRYQIMDVCAAYEQQALQEDACNICYPGVQETVVALAQRLPVFIVSNCQKGYIELFLEKTGLQACVKDFECFGNTGKAKAENIKDLVLRNGLQAPVYVGDTQGDCDASARAGVPFIHAAYGFGRVNRAAAVIAAFPELLQLTKEGGSKYGQQ